MSRRILLLIALASAVALLPGLLRGQTFYFKDGRTVSVPPAVIRGDNILVSLTLSGGGGTAELTLPISSLARVDWPVPPALARAEADLKAGHPADALKGLAPVLDQQEPFLAIPGSWWREGATIKAVALASLGKSDAANALLDRLRRADANPDAISRVEIAMAEYLVSSGDIKTATTQLDAIQAKATDDASLAAVAVLRGKILAKSGDTENALLSFLRVPVLYSAQDLRMPAALLGAAQAYRKLGDDAHADATLKTLTTDFPDSPEALSLKH